MFDAAVEVGVAAFMQGDVPPSDDMIIAELENSGVASWLAQRLLVFLPLAFGRRLLNDVEVSDSFRDPEGQHRLQQDPVFVWVAARAQRAVRAEVERIGLRSAEVDAVNRSLQAGSQLQDLTLGPMTLGNPLPSPSGDGGVPSPREMFEVLLTGHGVPVLEGRVGAAEIDARLTVHPRPRPDLVMGQADFAVRHPDLATPWLVESFAGLGSTWGTAVKQAVAKFERSVLHTLIAGLLDRTAYTDQIDWQTWEHPGGDFDVCLGPQLVLYSHAKPLQMNNTVDQLRQALAQIPLARAVHSLRIFICHDGDTLVTNEVFLDGQPWPAGQEITATAAPPETHDRIGTRIFILLIPG